MNEIDKKKYLDIINRNSSPKPQKHLFKHLLKQTLIVLIIFLSLAILCKKNDTMKEKVVNYLYSEDISFTKIKKAYNKYLGGILPLKKEATTDKVFTEKLKYDSLTPYKDGVELNITSNYLVPSLYEGMVVFIGEKEDYGKTIIIEDLTGIYTWYGNITSTSLKLYDYVEKGTMIGEATDKLYLVFTKGERYLNYEDYLK